MKRSRAFEYTKLSGQKYKKRGRLTRLVTVVLADFIANRAAISASFFFLLGF